MMMPIAFFHSCSIDSHLVTILGRPEQPRDVCSALLCGVACEETPGRPLSAPPAPEHGLDFTYYERKGEAMCSQ
jgi:hypothetical protein